MTAEKTKNAENAKNAKRAKNAKGGRSPKRKEWKVCKDHLKCKLCHE